MIRIGDAMSETKSMHGIKIRCYDCGKFISEKYKLFTLREPTIYYCYDCYKKRLEEEKIAMGWYEEAR